MYTTCIHCTTEPLEHTWNGLAIRQCPRCLLAWRVSFDLPYDYYTEKTVDLTPHKRAQRRRNSKQRIRRLLPYVGSFDQTCDIGCGEGIQLEAFADAGYRGCWGIDPSRAGYNFAKTHERTHELTIEQGMLEDSVHLSTQHSTRVITLFHLIEHLRDPRAALKTLYQVLPPGGTLVIETPHSQSYLLRKTNYHNSLVYPEHLFYYTPTNLEGLLTAAGFTVVATGKRDFDEDHMSITQCLTRLGLKQPPSTGDYTHRLGIERTAPEMVARETTSGLGALPKRLLRRVLCAGVRILSRSDYFWIVARKP